MAMFLTNYLEILDKVFKWQQAHQWAGAKKKKPQSHQEDVKFISQEDIRFISLEDIKFISQSARASGLVCVTV